MTKTVDRNASEVHVTNCYLKTICQHKLPIRDLGFVLFLPLYSHLFMCFNKGKKKDLMSSYD